MPQVVSGNVFFFFLSYALQHVVMKENIRKPDGWQKMTSVHMHISTIICKKTKIFFSLQCIGYVKQNSFFRLLISLEFSWHFMAFKCDTFSKSD